MIGSVGSLSAMTRAQLHSFHVRRYTPERMVVAVAGNVDHDEVVGLVREHFGPRLIRGRRPVAPRKGTGRVTGRPEMTVINREAEQTHILLRSELHRRIERTLRQLDEVTVDEVNAVARRLLTKPFGAAVLGPHPSKRAMPKELRAMVG